VTVPPGAIVAERGAYRESSTSTTAVVGFDDAGVGVGVGGTGVGVGGGGVGVAVAAGCVDTWVG
jgi:hypothetical protein